MLVQAQGGGQFDTRDKLGMLIGMLEDSSHIDCENCEYMVEYKHWTMSVIQDISHTSHLLYYLTLSLPCLIDLVKIVVSGPESEHRLVYDHSSMSELTCFAAISHKFTTRARLKLAF
jgi:hypothetical protein